MSTITKEWLQQKIADMEAARDEIPFGLDEDDSNTLTALRIAQASLEAEIHSYTFEDDPRPLYTAPPALVSVPDAYIRDDRGRMILNGKPEPRIGYGAGWNAYRAAMLQGADDNSPVIPDGYCIMPLKLTANNGAKGALCAEFHVQYRIVCQSCVGEGCEDCNHTGGWDAEIPVSWDTIKRIHEAAVEACALPVAPQQEA